MLARVAVYAAIVRAQMRPARGTAAAMRLNFWSRELEERAVGPAQCADPPPSMGQASVGPARRVARVGCGSWTL